MGVRVKAELWVRATRQCSALPGPTWEHVATSAEPGPARAGVQRQTTSSSSTRRISAQLLVYISLAVVLYFITARHGTARGQHVDPAHVDLTVHPGRFVLRVVHWSSGL